MNLSKYTERSKGFLQEAQIVARLIQRLKRNQLRQYVRLDYNGLLKLRLISTASDSTSSVRRGEIIECKFSDISGGGCSFVSERQLRPGDIVSLTFALRDNNFAGVAGKILRTSLHDSVSKTLYRHHVQFADLDQRRRDAIVHYVFEKQRQQNQVR